MTFLQALVLGIIQGITEFLPISSSGHLVLTPFLFGWSIPAEQKFSFDVLVQLGTLVAVFAYFWKDIRTILTDFFQGLFHGAPFATPQSRLGWYLIVSAIPAGIFGFLLKDYIEEAFGSPVITAFFLFGTAALLFIGERLGKRNRSLNQAGWKDALWIGAAQILSLFPGVSRSGATIAGGMTRNLERKEAGRFSFLMSIPIMLAAGLYSALDLVNVPDLSTFLPVLAVGFVTAAVVGYISIAWLLSFLNRGSLIGFAIYCIAVASLILVFAYVSPSI
jgi:undecaprenyl-diphosphatase